MNKNEEKNIFFLEIVDLFSEKLILKCLKKLIIFNEIKIICLLHDIWCRTSKINKNSVGGVASFIQSRKWSWQLSFSSKRSSLKRKSSVFGAASKSVRNTPPHDLHDKRTQFKFPVPPSIISHVVSQTISPENKYENAYQKLLIQNCILKKSRTSAHDSAKAIFLNFFAPNLNVECVQISRKAHVYHTHILNIRWLFCVIINVSSISILQKGKLLKVLNVGVVVVSVVQYIYYMDFIPYCVSISWIKNNEFVKIVS